MNQIVFPEVPFFMEFKYENITSRIILENGEDLINLSMILSEFLSKNGIKNKLDIISEIK